MHDQNVLGCLVLGFDVRISNFRMYVLPTFELLMIEPYCLLDKKEKDYKVSCLCLPHFSLVSSQ